METGIEYRVKFMFDSSGVSDRQLQLPSELFSTARIL